MAAAPDPERHAAAEVRSAAFAAFAAAAVAAAADATAGCPRLVAAVADLRAEGSCWWSALSPVGARESTCTQEVRGAVPF